MLYSCFISNLEEKYRHTNTEDKLQVKERAQHFLKCGGHRYNLLPFLLNYKKKNQTVAKQAISSLHPSRGPLGRLGFMLRDVFRPTTKCNHRD